MMHRRMALQAAGVLTCFMLAELGAAAGPLSPSDAAALLQRISDASRRLAYEGVFVVQHGSAIQTLSVTNRPAGAANESHLSALDGKQREIRCNQTGSIVRVTEAGRTKTEKRLNSRHFPD